MSGAPRTGEAAASDRYFIISPITKNRTYGPDRDVQALVPANLNGIMQEPLGVGAQDCRDPPDRLCDMRKARQKPVLVSRGLYEGLRKVDSDAGAGHDSRMMPKNRVEDTPNIILRSKKYEMPYGCSSKTSRRPPRLFYGIPRSRHASES